ncbi:MAG: LLM class flavin-dependent oxidoreductase [Nocardiopsaceae bacterium]|nr:LLM class flavin-dependent oxidoreductase [Nocardiopsaceae bacterium]
MRFGIAIPQLHADGEFDPAAFRSYFSAVEALECYDSAWAQEATLGTGAQISPVTAMTYAAAVTSRLRLGCVVFVSTLHSPVHLAKDLASLDQLSLGRLDVGVGTGGPRRPFAAFGVDSSRYAARFDEGVRLMKELWTSPRVTFDGSFWQLKEAAMEPKPRQRPHPPLWFGASAPAALRRAVRLGDGFFGAGSSTTEAFASQVRTLREALTAAGRSPAGFPVAKRVYISVGSSASAARERVNDGLARVYGARIPAIEQAAIAGTVSDCVRAVQEVIDAGAGLVLFTALHDQLEHAELIASEIIPRLG